MPQTTPMSAIPSLADQLRRFDPKSDRFAVEIVQLLLDVARQSRASDLHLVPNAAKQIEVACRIDGLLQPVAVIEPSPQNVIARLKVLAELLTYRTDVPQEGRIRQGDGQVEMRVSSFPTVHGEKAVVRLFVGSGHHQQLEDLAYPEDVLAQCQSWLRQPQGALLVTGPAGSGKTTTLYAALRHIQRTSVSLRSMCSLEDPIEALVPGVAQSQIQPQAGFTYEVGLKSLLRQDPEVLMVGEIRDPATASIVFQAALTGHQVLTTFHAGRAAEACGRLLDMGIEPYVLKSGLRGILAQRLVRCLCDCRHESRDPAELSGLGIERAWLPTGCPSCGQTGYSGRIPLVESLVPTKEVGVAILRRADAEEIEKAAISSGMVSLRTRATTAVMLGQTSPLEVLRVLGWET